MNSTRRLGVSADGRVVCVASKDNRVRVWDVKTGRLQYTLELDQPGKAVALSPAGDLLVAGTIGERKDASEPVWSHLFAWSLTGKTPRPLWKKRQVGAAEAMAIDANRRWCAVATVYGELHLFDLRTGNLKRTLLDPGNGIGDLAIAPNGRTVITAGQWLKVWDPVAVPLPAGSLPVGARITEAESERFLKAKHGFASAVAVAPDGRWAVAMSGFGSMSGRTNTLARIELPSGNSIQALAKELNDVNCLAVSPDASLIALGFDSPKVEIRTADGATVTRTFNMGDFGEVRSLAFLNGGQHLAIVNRHGMQVEIRAVSDGSRSQKLLLEG